MHWFIWVLCHAFCASNLHKKENFGAGTLFAPPCTGSKSHFPGILLRIYMPLWMLLQWLLQLQAFPWENSFLFFVLTKEVTQSETAVCLQHQWLSCQACVTTWEFPVLVTLCIWVFDPSGDGLDNGVLWFPEIYFFSDKIDSSPYSYPMTKVKSFCRNMSFFKLPAMHGIFAVSVSSGT